MYILICITEIPTPIHRNSAVNARRPALAGPAAQVCMHMYILGHKTEILASMQEFLYDVYTHTHTHTHTYLAHMLDVLAHCLGVVFKYARAQTHTYTHTHIHTHTSLTHLMFSHTALA